MNEVLKRFLVQIGFDNAQLKAGVNDSKNILAGFGKYFNGILVTYFGASAMKSAITGFNEFNFAVEKASVTLGANAQQVAGAANAFKAFGVENSEVIGSLNSLNSAFQQARFGGGALVDTARKYGLYLGNLRGGMKNAGEVLARLSSQIGKYSTQTQKAILSGLGFSENMQYAFMSAGASLGELIKKETQNAAQMAKDIELSKKFRLATFALNNEFLKLKNAFARFAIPLLTKLTNGFIKFIEFLQRHKLVVAAFFAGLAIAAAPVLLILAKMAIASAVAFAPIIAGVAALSAVALVFEDIYGYFMGWDTVTGELVKKFPFLANSLEVLRPIVLSIADVFKQIGDFFDNPNLENLQKIFTKIWDSILIYFQETIGQAFMLAGDTIQAYLDAAWTAITGKMWRAWLTLTDGLKDAFKSVCDFISNLINTYIIEPLNKVLGMFSAIGDSVKGVADKVGGAFEGAWGGVKSFFGFDNEKKTAPIIAPQPPVISGAVTTNNRAFSDNRTQNINVNVNGTLSDQNAAAFGQSLGEQLHSKTLQNGNTGAF